MANYELRSLTPDGHIIASEPFENLSEATSAFMCSQDYAVENGGRFALVRVEDERVLASCERAKR
jgi:hypothetical protein